jgi:putative membrane protein
VTNVLLYDPFYFSSTSYDRYWEGRKSFAQLISNARSLSRQIWVNVALPPTENEPAYVKGKTPRTDLSDTQLRQRKVEALKLCLGFVYATKHYLRGEDGLAHADYQGILPIPFVRLGDPGRLTSSTHSRSHSSHRTYNTIKPNSNSSAVCIVEASSENSYCSSRCSSPGPDLVTAPDATKRVRVKRSQPQLADHATPLLGDTHHSVDLETKAAASMPLPLVSALLFLSVCYG